MYGVTHVVSVDAPCPACKHALADHSPSGRSAQGQTGPVVVVCGRCIADGIRAPQKLCWVLLDGPLTVGEYLEAYGDGERRPPKPPCPCCGGPTVYHGSYERLVADGESGPAVSVTILRVRCPSRDCPVVTITLFPPFVTPYVRFATPVRERVLRDHDEHGTPWEHLAEASGADPDTVRRWARSLRLRAAALASGFAAIALSYDPAARLPPARAGPAALWALGDAAAKGLDLPHWPRLAVARLALIAGPLPVWA